MNILTKLIPQKISIVCTVLLLSACGGGSGSSTTGNTVVASTADLSTLAENAVAQPLVVVPTQMTTKDIVSALPGIADVYIGTVDLPYYFDTSNSTTSFWLPTLDVRETLTVPVLMTIPNGISPTSPSGADVMPEGGWPIVMFQHGITQDRSNLIAIADALAQAGFAAIAIDLPAHGITNVLNPLHADNSTNPFPNDVEQTYGVDQLTHTGTVDDDGLPIDLPVSDGIVDDSGKHFINLRSLLTSRDNVRQGAANLLTLRKSLGGIINGATGTAVTIDTSRVGLVAHSLGGMVAIPYLGAETTPTPTSILTSGATITMVLKDSLSFSPVINKGLAGLGVTTPAGIGAFYANAQELVDAGEPANYAAAAAANHPIHLIEVLGDTTVPNSSTENLASIMGATSVTSTSVGIAPGNPGIVRLTAGSHSSPLDPGTTPASFGAFGEIQQQVAFFQATSGTVIRVCNGDVVEDAAAGNACN